MMSCSDIVGKGRGAGEGRAGQDIRGRRHAGYNALSAHQVLWRCDLPSSAANFPDVQCLLQYGAAPCHGRSRYVTDFLKWLNAPKTHSNLALGASDRAVKWGALNRISHKSVVRSAGQDHRVAQYDTDPNNGPVELMAAALL